MSVSTYNDISIGWFAQQVLGQPLYPYQQIIGEAILRSVHEGRGETFTVMMARQMGKNQLSAVLEAYLLYYQGEGTIIKVAPTYTPQIITSRSRLLHLLEMCPETQTRTWRAHGYVVGLAPTAEQVKAQRGPRVLFFSAGPQSHIVGATASLLLEIDEAQDVAIEKYDVELKPMVATRNATTVLYGTAWSDDTLLARMRTHNLALEESDGIRRHFEFDWRELARLNEHYRRFVEGEIERLGEEHVSIRTQYRLLPISGAGLLFSEWQRHLLRGTHPWLERPDDRDNGFYIAGLDVGGEERERASLSSGKRDASVLTIGRAGTNEFDLPEIAVVHQEWWTGMKYTQQYAAVCALMELWNVRRLVVDRTGLGETLAALLVERFGDERVQAFRFTRASKSALTYHLLSLVNSARLRLPDPARVPPALEEECWRQIRLARCHPVGDGLLNMQVNPSEGHDDFLISLALCCEAIREWSNPVQESRVIRPNTLYTDGTF
jgi:hypothetical protein